jgi:DNA-binding response OmpR family regulator
VSNTEGAGRPGPYEPEVALVVENDPWIRLVMCDLLAQAGYRVAQASNGFSALRLAQREPLAMVLLDLVLPERSGLSVLAELRAAPATAHVPAIVVSRHSQILRDAVMQADAVIAKPFAIDTLLAEVNRSRQRAVNAVGGSAVGDAAHVLRSARESPGNGDGFSPGCGQVLVRGYGPDVIGNNVFCHSGPADGAG